MFDIYEALRSGMNADELVAAFTKELNDAEARVKEEEAQAIAAAVQKAEERKTYFTGIIRDLMRGFALYYPELDIQEDEINDESCEAIAELIMLALDAEVKATRKSMTLPVKLEVKKSADKDAFAKFFEQFGL